MPDHHPHDNIHTTIAELERLTETGGQHQSRAESRPLRVLTPDQCELEPTRPYVIKGLLSAGDHAILMGHPGSGKSVLAPHLAYAVAQGREVLGRRVKGGPVLYLAPEDGAGTIHRTRALRRRRGNAPNFYLVPVALDLLTPGSPQLQELLDLIAELRPVLIVIDTIGKAFPNLRENEAEDMGRMVRVVRQLTTVCGSAVLSVHHLAKDAGTTPRGHGCLNGDADLTMLLEGTRGDLRTVKLGKNRSGPSDASFAFNIAVEELGIDEDGDPITAPIAEEAVEVPADRMRAKEAKLRDKPAVLLRELRDLIAEQGGAAEPEPGMPSVICVERGMLRRRLIARSWFSEDLLRTAPHGDAELTRSGYRPESHALTTLKRNGFLCFTRNLIWLL